MVCSSVVIIAVIAAGVSTRFLLITHALQNNNSVNLGLVPIHDVTGPYKEGFDWVSGDGRMVSVARVWKLYHDFAI